MSNDAVFPRRAAVAAALGCLVLAAGCGGGMPGGAGHVNQAEEAPATPGEEAPADPGQAAPGDRTRDEIDSALDRAVRDVVDKHGGEAAVAIAVPGEAPYAGRYGAGHVSDESAWSTSKVPVAIAAVRDDATGWTRDLVEPMITESDNDAAENAWTSMGPAATAAEHTDEVLRDGGDVHTWFTAETAPGDVRWTVEDQAVFASNLPCIDGADSVVEAMGRIVPDQSYGLGGIDGAHFKGGWGPDDEGNYLMRQVGYVPADGGVVGVAIAARPGDAADGTGRDMLDELARAVAAHLPAGGSCGG